MPKKPVREVEYTEQVLLKYYSIPIGILDNQTINVLVAVVWTSTMKAKGMIIHVTIYLIHFFKFQSKEIQSNIY